MCGIAGKVSLEAPIASGLVEAMCEQQVHRGPDSRGLHESPGVVLGIQRLRVIDLETGDQPIYNEDGAVAVVLNGEIYNYRELRRDLERRGHSFSTKGDTEVIAHLYEERGPDLVHELQGMFAFAIWDERRRRLVLARDRIGKKPLFYAMGDGWLSFASELRALMSDPAVPRELDASSLDCYLAYGYIPAPWSVWRGVKKLLPGHTLVWEQGQTTTRRYWSLDYSRKRDEDPRELQEELRRLVAAAVRRRMVADVPLGAFLSGGVDSSIVVSEMASHSSKPVRTFSIGFEEKRYDELPRARLVAERFSTDHHEFVVEPKAAEIVPKVVRHYGEPYADSSAIPSFYLAELTRQHVTVALNGDGGDENFAGYLRHAANGLTAGIDRVPMAWRRLIARLGGGLRARDGKDRLEYARRFLVSLPGGAAERYMSHVSIFDAAWRQSILDPGFAGGVDPARARGAILDPWECASGRDVLDVILEVDVNTYLPDDLLVKMDIASMAYSLEARSPLLDHELMEFAASLSPRHKAGWTSRKRLLRDAYRDLIPNSILEGKKMGFAVPLARWLRGSLRPLVRQVLLEEPGLTADILATSRVRALVEEHQSGRRDHAARIWSLLALELWHTEVANQSPGRPSPQPLSSSSSW